MGVCALIVACRQSGGTKSQSPPCCSGVRIRCSMKWKGFLERLRTVQLLSLWAALPNPLLQTDGSVVLEYQDRQIRNLLSFEPKAFFLPRIFTTAPEWWVEVNPGELCQYGSGRTVSSNGRKIPPRESMASQKYLDEIGGAYRKVVRQLLDADYGRQLMGIHVAGGPWGEHFYWDAYHFSTDRPAASDVSEPMRLALVEYLKRKYDNDVKHLRKAWNDDELTFDTVRVPGLRDRVKTTAGAWRDPARFSRRDGLFRMSSRGRRPNDRPFLPDRQRGE